MAKRVLNSKTKPFSTVGDINIPLKGLNNSPVELQTQVTKGEIGLAPNSFKTKRNPKRITTILKTISMKELIILKPFIYLKLIIRKFREQIKTQEDFVFQENKKELYLEYYYKQI